MKNVSVDLPNRTEKRYIIQAPEALLEAISPHVREKVFSDNEYVQTTYFNNEDHVVPFTLSLKARKYLPEPITLPEIDDCIYLLDVKTGKKDNKQKVRRESTLRDAVELINRTYKFQRPVRPYTTVGYHRNHYVPNNGNGMRITIDNGMEYFLFPEGQTAGEFIGQEDYTRVEVKGDDNDETFRMLIRLIESLDVHPAISKKFTAYGLMGMCVTRKFGKKLRKDIKDCEIEAKLETDSEDVFYEMKDLFRGEESGFRLPPHFPFTIESASINRYLRNSDGIFKAKLGYDQIELVKKSETEIVDDLLRTNCIMKRRELKGTVVPMDSDILKQAEILGELYRMRKAFWVDTPNGRTYHISIDHCDGHPGTLYEVEVEYVGNYEGTETAEEGKVVDDISRITDMFIKRFPSVRPSQLTKQAWLGIK